MSNRLEELAGDLDEDHPNEAAILRALVPLFRKAGVPDVLPSSHEGIPPALPEEAAHLGWKVALAFKETLKIIPLPSGVLTLAFAQGVHDHLDLSLFSDTTPTLNLLMPTGLQLKSRIRSTDQAEKALVLADVPPRMRGTYNGIVLQADRHQYKSLGQVRDINLETMGHKFKLPRGSVQFLQVAFKRVT